MRMMKDTFLYEMQNKSTNLRDNMLLYSSTLDDLSLDLMEEELRIITKKYNYPMKNKVIDDLTSKKRVIPIFNKERIKIPTYIPAYLFTVNNKVVSLVNLTNYGVMSKTKEEFAIDTKQLFACLQTGSILLGCYEKWNSIIMNQTICKLGALLYTKFLFKVFDKMYAVNLDAIKSDKLRFVCAKFFLLNLLGKSDSESVNNMAYSCISNNTSLTTVKIFENSLPTNTYRRFDDFLKALKGNVDGFRTLSIRTFLDTSLRMYGVSTLFALEFFPMFCHMLFSTAIGAHLNGEYVLESMLGNDIDRFYNEIANIIR